MSHREDHTYRGKLGAKVREAESLYRYQFLCSTRASRTCGPEI